MQREVNYLSYNLRTANCERLVTRHERLEKSIRMSTYLHIYLHARRSSSSARRVSEVGAESK